MVNISCAAKSISFIQILTVSNIHLTSLAAPMQPKNETMHTKADVIIKTYVAPANRFVPSNSFIKFLSTTVHIPSPNIMAPPTFKI